MTSEEIGTAATAAYNAVVADYDQQVALEPAWVTARVTALLVPEEPDRTGDPIDARPKAAIAAFDAVVTALLSFYVP